MYTYLDAYNTYNAERPFDKQNLLHKFYEFKKKFWWNNKRKSIPDCVIDVYYLFKFLTHLFHPEDKLVEEKLQSFICKIDTQLLKAVLFKIL